MNTFTLMTAASCAFLFGTLQAQPIGIDAQATFGQARTWSPGTTTFDNATLSGGAFDPSASDKLIAILGFRASGTPGFASVTYGGVAMTEAIQHTASNNRAMTGIFYLDNPGAAGDLSITVNNSGFGYAVSLLAVSGTASGFSVASSGDATSTVLNSVGAGSLVVAQHSVETDDVTLTGTSPLVDLLQHAPLDSGSGEGSHISAYANNVSAGNFTAAFTGGGSDPSISAVAFAVPEPGSFALMAGLLGLTWVAMRRR
ncbi:MAG: PEP-CTERM sorting domain-containing protein [Opitutales bacterium]